MACKNKTKPFLIRKLYHTYIEIMKFIESAVAIEGPLKVAFAVYSYIQLI
ncbi:hypothetical protein ABIC55_003939 [Sporosarcina psychrophila]|uniref:Uncharacterized protein n=1 Tax=Sporosarcina psychrophila TaxID=1476 RepID=A0ABV2KCM5_SPOPS